MSLATKVLEARLEHEKKAKVAYEEAYAKWSSTPPGKAQSLAFKRMMRAMKAWASTKASVESAKKAMGRP